ncbi:ABC transporter permease subunit [Actinoplanes sp. CA-142083]|uniref:ABC transporter permease subunit n=1 Tax=Actinoplanes sp. CA-142083 TaxID=3239903 RepID=UPI003D8F29E1
MIGAGGPGLRAVRAELTKLRSVRAWVVGIAMIFVVIVGLGALGAEGIQVDCPDGPCPKPPTGPGGEAVRDQFSYVHQPLDGDGQLTAHIASFEGIITYPPPNHDTIVNGLVPWAKAGLMVKDGTNEGAAYAAVMLTGSHGVRMQHAFTEDKAGPANASWLRLARKGNTITGYASADGATWQKVGEADLGDLPQAVQIGLFVASPSDVTSKANARGGSIVQARWTQATAAFDQIDRQGEWTFTDVGDEGLRTDWEKNNEPAGVTRDGGQFRVTGSGDIAPAGNEAGPTLTFTLIGMIGALIAAIIVGVLFITGEYRRGLIRTTFAATPARGRLLTAKAIVIGGVTFVIGLVSAAIALPLGRFLVESNDGYLLPASLGTQLRVITGAGLLLSLTAILAYGMGATLRRGVLAVTAAIVLVVLPYLLATASILPAGAAVWLLRLTPAAGFAFQQVLPAYHQVKIPYSPSDGYFPLSPWAGLGVVAVWAVAFVGLAVFRARRADA